VPQSLPMTRTELTRRCWFIEPDADAVEPVAAPPVVPAVVPAVEPVALPDMDAFATLPVTSTRLPTSDVRSVELPSRT
jgi:hypothetical protein